MRRALVAAALLAACTPRVAADGPDTVYVVSKGEPRLFRLDLERRGIAIEAATGIKAHEIAVSPDGRLVYAPIYSDSIVGRPGSNGSTIEIYDAATLKRVDTIDLGAGLRPHSPIFAPDGRLWVTAEITREVIAIDPRNRRIVGRAPTGQPESHGIALSPDGRTAYTANVGPGTVSVIDLEGSRVVAVIPVARRIQRVTVSRDGRLLFTHDVETPRLAVIDTVTNKLARWVDLPDRPYVSVATRDGRSLLVGSPFGRSLHLVDLATMTVSRSAKVDCDPTNIELAADGRTAYLSCPALGKVAAVDAATLAPIAEVPVVRGLEGLAVAPRGHR